LSDSVVGTTSVDALAAKRLSNSGRRYASSQSSGRFGARDLRIGQHTIGFETIQRFVDKPDIWFNPAQLQLEFATCFASTGKRIDRTVDKSSDSRRVPEALKSRRVEYCSDACGPRFRKCINTNHVLLAVREHHEIPPRRSRRLA
jgi:hypothetical protein